MPLNPANLITAGRILLAPVLLLLAWFGQDRAFTVCLVISLVSDIVDGQVARRFHFASELGTRLDSWADFLTYASVPLAMWWLRPDVVSSERVVFGLALASYAVPIALGFVKFRRLTTYHTFLARLSAYLLGAAVVVMFLHGPLLLLRGAVAVLVLAELEEIAITLLLPEPHSNVRHLGRALELRRRRPAPDRPA